MVNELVAAGHELRVVTAGTGPAAYHSVGVSRFGPPRRNHKRISSRTWAVAVEELVAEQYGAVLGKRVPRVA